MILYNKKQLEVFKASLDNANLPINITVEDASKPKTNKQLAFIFGAIIKPVVAHYKKAGVKYTQTEVKNIFYKHLSEVCLLKRKVRDFNGGVIEVDKTLSDMTVDEASEFINNVLFIIDNAKSFENMYLHPSVRYSWSLHITPDDYITAELPRIDKEYLSHLRKQPCIWCGRANNSEAHHLKDGGNDSGTSYKSGDWYALPLCDKCHKDYHEKGREAFDTDMAWIGMPLKEFCKINYNRWRFKK